MLGCLSFRAGVVRMASTGQLRQSVLSGYRRLMRVRKHVFAGDKHAIEQARKQLRTEFSKNRSVTDPREIEGLVRGVQEVEEMLSKNVVQGRLNQHGNYAVKVNPEELQGREVTPITHVDDRLVGKSIVVEHTKGSSGAGSAQPGSTCGGSKQ